MPAPDQLLRGHPLYGLDRAIADYLGPCLERQFGEPFRRWRAQEDARTLAAVDATLHLAPTLAGKPLELQEDILPGAAPASRQLSEAWNRLLVLTQGEWRGLCLLYGQVLAELRDLSCMAAAQHAAEESGDPAHASQVRRVLALDAALAPSWLPVG